jgi:hypothetical protein
VNLSNILAALRKLSLTVCTCLQKRRVPEQPIAPPRRIEFVAVDLYDR